MTPKTPILNAQEARQLMTGNVFLFIHGRADLKLPIKISEELEIKEYDKWLYGRITDVDRSMIEVTDTGDEVHLFKTAKIIECRAAALRRITWRMPKKFTHHLKPGTSW